MSRLRLQEQPRFMVLASYDDSLVFQFDKPPHHSHIKRTLNFRALLFLRSLTSFVADHTKLYTRQTSCGDIHLCRETVIGCSDRRHTLPLLFVWRRQRAPQATSHFPLPLHRSTHKRQLQKPQGRALRPQAKVHDGVLGHLRYP